MQTWDALHERLRELESLNGIRATLEWDKQVKMPPQGAAARASQVEVLSAIVHQRITEPVVGEWLTALEQGPELDAFHKAAVRNVRKSYDRAIKLPEDLVRATARATAAGFQAWMAAKQADDFRGFAEPLAEIIRLKLESVRLLRTDEEHPYDVLLDQFDPGATVRMLDPMFDRLATGIGELLDAIDGRPHPDRIEGQFDLAGQRALHQELIASLGYDLGAGRLDEAEHPFTVTLGRGDTRITTHYYTDDLIKGLGGTVHETGHALYEQGIPLDWRGTGVGEAAGMGLHESQSRFWENFIGRSLPFCEFLAPKIHNHLGLDYTPEQLFGAQNRVQRSLIRIAADEATYNLHIIVRYRLEKALLTGDLQVPDLPQAWADTYEQVVGVRPSTPAEGVLQDVHWSSGALGYFPSYTIGNLYAASLGAALLEDRPGLWEEISAGEFGPTLAWLRERIHSKGHLDDAPVLMRQAIGDRDHVADMLDHLWRRQGALYGVTRD
jgi:carboxypeptidase Taq